MDNTVPAGTLSTPDSRATTNSLPILSGTASDTTPGAVQSVVFRVARSEDATKLWNWQASTFTASAGAATDLTATLNTGVWSYTTDYFLMNTGTGTWEHGKAYIVHEIITDKAGNQTDVAHAGFTFDIHAPTATLVVPAIVSTSGITGLASISGTTSDEYGIQYAQIGLQRQSDGRWFDGANFTVGQVAPNRLPMTTLTSGATQWTYSAGGALNGKLADNNRFTLVVRSSDVAANMQANFVVPTSSFSFIMDKTAPTVTISAPPTQAGSYKAADIGNVGGGSAFGGTDADANTLATGVKRVQLRLSYLLSGDTYYWDGSNFSSTTVNATTAWQSINSPGSPCT